MKFSHIALIIYILGFVTVILASRYIPFVNEKLADDDDDDSSPVLFAVFWPVILVIGSAIGIIMGLHNFACGKPIIKRKKAESPVVPEIKRIDIMEAWMPYVSPASKPKKPKNELRSLDV
jgi:hypothetical protein